MKYFDYLKNLAIAVIDKCTFIKDTEYGGKLALLYPSGDEKYPSFWMRDCAMMAESGLIENDFFKKYVEIIAEYGQNSDIQIYLKNGLIVPPFAVADHINLNGKPVFFPGTYSDTADQGNGNYGFYPPFCDNYYFILMTYYYILQSSDTKILENNYNNFKLITRLKKAFEGYNVDRNTELCYSLSDKYTVDWGFTDSVKKSGYLLMPSLLRYNAACAMEKLTGEYIYKLTAEKIKKILFLLFLMKKVAGCILQQVFANSMMYGLRHMLYISV